MTKLWHGPTALAATRLVQHQTRTTSTTATPRLRRIHSRKYGVFQPKEVDCRRPRPGQLVQQGLRPIDQEWQGSEDCERAVPATRHPVLVESMQGMSGDCSYRLFEERLVVGPCQKSTTNVRQLRRLYFQTHQQDPKPFPMASTSFQTPMLS